MVRYLLAEGANIDAVSPNGTTALMMAVREHHPETMRVLIGRGANVNHRNQDGASALAWAKRAEEVDMAKELRRAGATD
jgi:ankyrin repeat protein